MKIVNLTKKLDKMDRSYRVRPKKRKFMGRILLILLVFILLNIVPSYLIYSGVKDLNVSGKALISAYENQNFDSLKKELGFTKANLQKVNLSLKLLFWVRFIPFIGGYYQDMTSFAQAGVWELESLEAIFKNIEDKKKELGFDGVPKSGPERIVQGTKMLEVSLPVLDKVEGNILRAADEVKNINTNKYPETFRGKQVRADLEVAKNFIIGTGVAMGEGRQALEITPTALGVPTKKNYLLLFQNDKEIRSTGGFLTAFATMTIDNGKIFPSTSDDIYRLDEKLLTVCLTKICPLTPPAPIVKYLPEESGKPRSAWSMRDSNLSPDVPTSAKQFEKMYQLLGEGLPFDGIVYIDTQVVEQMIEVTGPINVFGTTYSAEIDQRCSCPNVIFQLEAYAEIAAKGEKDRKAVLGVLMQQMLSKVLGAETNKLPQLIETIATLANHKHVMFYMHDTKAQQALAALNWVGEIKQYDGDYLHINDANFAGGKSNLYVEQTVTQEINIKGGKVTKKITIDYKNPQQFNRWLNGINRDYVRIYAPKGSKLISSKGSEDQVNIIEELGKTVFETFITVRPENSRKLEIEYEIPYNANGKYKIMVQKQPGAKDFHYIIKVNGSKKEDFLLDHDREFEFDI